MLENKVFELEQKYNSLRENLQMTDEYSRHIMSTTFTILSIVIVITTSITIIAAYFIIRQIINNKVEMEIENKVLKILRDNPPIYSASGKSAPENDEIILDSDIAGIDELDPNTLIFVSA